MVSLAVVEDKVVEIEIARVDGNVAEEKIQHAIVASHHCQGMMK